MESVTTYCQASYLLSGKATYCQAKLPTVRQATYCQASYLQSGKLPTVRQATYSQACTQPIHRHAPKRHRHAPKRLHILCTQQPYTFSSNIFGK